jgi:hypothetical protein
MNSNAKKTSHIQAVDPVWEAVRAGARQILDSEPPLGNLVLSTIPIVWRRDSIMRMSRPTSSGSPLPR